MNGAQTVTAGAAQANGSVTLGGLTIPAGTTLKLFPAQANPPIKVNGAVSIAGPLDVTLTRATVVKGTPLVLIQNDDTDPIVGQFAGLAEDELMPSPFGDLRISYRGSTGNDFTLLLALPSYQLSEGATGTFFDTRSADRQPERQPVPITATFLKPAAATVAAAIHAAADVATDDPRRRDRRPRSHGGLDHRHGRTIDRPLIVRAHDAVGRDGLRRAHRQGDERPGAATWYFAEGSQGFFLHVSAARQSAGRRRTPRR